MTEKKKVTLKVAEIEFNEWAAALEISTDTSGFDDEDLKAFKGFKSKFLSRIVAGRLAVNEDGTLTLSPRGVDATITFTEPMGSVLSARMKGDTDVQASRRILAEWTGAPAATFADMALNDANFCVELLGFFGNS